MKKTVLILSALFCAAPLVEADEVALLTLDTGNPKNPQRVALEFYPADAPGHVENFKKLAQKGFYKGLALHRVFPRLLVQTGDPLSKGKDRSKVGTGGPGYTLPPEIRRKHVKGAVAAARLPDTINPSRVSNGSQFYVCLAPMPAYDGQYTVFGQVIYGMDVLELLSTRSVDTNDNPLERIEIQSVKILSRETLPPPTAPAKPGPPQKVRRWWQIFR